MGQSHAARYQVDEMILSSSNGSLYIGKDLSLQRTIFLYQTSQCKGTAPKEYMRRIADVSGASDPRLLHILDISRVNESIYVVLEARLGQPLANLFPVNWPLWKKIQFVCEVGKMIQLAGEQQIRGIAVTAENIWLSEGHQPAIINYWSEGDLQTRGKNGLVSLFYQLQTNSLVIPAHPQAMLQQISQSLADELPYIRDKIVQVFHSTLSHDLNLATAVQNFGELLSLENSVQMTPLPKPLYDPPNQAHEKVHFQPKKKETKNFRLLAGIILTLTFLGFASYAWSSLSVEPTLSGPGTEEETTMAPIVKQQHVPENLGTENLPLEENEPQAIQPETAEENSTFIMPDLQNMKKEDAEQTALAYGLHYQYFLEYANFPEGHVYKQNLSAGEHIQKGDTISFWVSKGPAPSSP